ncbi:hypothetical protein FKW77_007331 [Venturia effusa]|uniref:Uncharacterized protein n=1 Tax=Venturia effusa TaxID=50376 RepID=A0A517LCK7_9PEZI|nr:hypothetical protein FKW77_007331 [Venturia effusa]
MHLPKFEKSAALSTFFDKFSTPPLWCLLQTTHKHIGDQYLHRQARSDMHELPFHIPLWKAHQCQACTHAETLLHNRHRDIAEYIHVFKTLYPTNPATTAIENGGMMTPPLQVEDLSTPARKLKKREKKDLKRVEKAATRAKIVTHADIAELGEIMYPNGIGGTGNVDSILSDALSIKFQPSVFSEIRLMEKLMIPSGTTPDYTEEVDRVLRELNIQKSAMADKEESRIWDKIRSKLREDMEITWNGSVQMKRRRIIYAQWVSQGAVDAMAQWAEDWDIGTGWKIDGGFCVTAAGKEDEVNAGADAIVGAEESSDGEDVDGDDAVTVTSSLSGLSIGKSHGPVVEKPIIPLPNVNIQMIKDERRGGYPMDDRVVRRPIKSKFFGASDEDVIPSPDFKPSFIANETDEETFQPVRAPAVLRIVPDGAATSLAMMKENIAPTVPLTKPWNEIGAAENRQKRKADVLAVHPWPPRILRITSPVEEEVDDGSWIAVGKKGKPK